MSEQGPDRGELEALKEHFLELIEREPACDLGNVFDEIIRWRIGAMIARSPPYDR